MEFKEFNEINKEVLKPAQYILDAVESILPEHRKYVSKMSVMIEDMKNFVRRFENGFDEGIYASNFHTPVILSYIMSLYSNYGKVPFTREQMSKLSEHASHYKEKKRSVFDVIILTLNQLKAVDWVISADLNQFEEIYLARLDRAITDEERLMIIGLTIYALTVDYENEGKYIGGENIINNGQGVIDVNRMVEGFIPLVSEDPLA